MFTVDGISWDIPCDITRLADIMASEISGMLLNGVYFYDDLGTYLSYDVKLTPNPHRMGDYYALFEALTAPNSVHTFLLPYNGDTVEISAHVGETNDVYVRLPGGRVYWRGLEFTLTSIASTKSITLGESIARGLPALPSVALPNIGDTYTWTVDGWELTESYEDADLIAF